MHYVAKLVRAGERTLITFPDAQGAANFAEPGEDMHDVARAAVERWLVAQLEAGDTPARPLIESGRAPGSMLPVRIGPQLAVRLQLRWARQDAGISQGQLARLVGVSRQQISLLESPDANLTLRTLEKVASALGLTVDVTLVAPELVRAKTSMGSTPANHLPSPRLGRKSLS